MSWVSQGLKIQSTLKNTARLSEIISVFASCGFTPWIKKLKLTRLISPLKKHPELTEAPLPERLRIAFEHLGPTFIKFGQILSTRHDLLPQHFIASFEKLQAQVNCIDFDDINQILVQQWGADFKQRFTYIEATPLGSASIAQVHRAQLITGEDVVLKIQKPQVVEMIKEDLRILMFLAELIHNSISELRGFGIPDLVTEFAEALSKETEFFLEANNIRKFYETYQDQPHVKIPRVFWEFTTEKILVLEELKGYPLSHSQSLNTLNLEPETMGHWILTQYLEQVFVHGFFHGDLHPGNVLILNDQEFGLIDFGMTGRLNHKTKIAVIKMLQALGNEDYESLATEYIHLSPFDEKIQVERFALGLQQLLSPYFGLNLNHINVGELLLKTAQLAAKEGLHIPRELLVFFKSLVGIESIIRKLKPNFNFLKSSLDFASSEQTQELSFQEWKKGLGFLLKDSEHFIKDLPKQLHYLLKKWNSPQFEFRLGGRQLERHVRATQSVGHSIFWGLVSLGLILSSTLLFLFDQKNPQHLIMMQLVLLGFISFRLLWPKRF